MTIITDEMVEKGAKAIIERYTKVSDAPLHTESRMRMAMPDARAALEAVEPMIRKHYANLAREWITNNDPSFIEFISEMNAIRAKGLQ